MLPSMPFLLLSYKSPPVSPPPPLTLRTTSSWSHVGAPLSPSSLPQGYQTWAHSTISSGELTSLLEPFLDYLNSWVIERGVTHYLLTIRAQKATKEFEVPRWHVDRRAFDPPLKGEFENSERDDGGPQKNKKEGGSQPLQGREEPSVWKVATALQGPGTLFLHDSERGMEILKSIERSLKQPEHEEHECHTLRCLGCADMAASVRFKLAAAVEKEMLEIVKMEERECALFRAEGGEGVAAMHSEPNIEADRVFVHVVLGTERGLKRLVEGWGMEFPRDWSVGGVFNWGVQT